MKPFLSLLLPAALLLFLVPRNTEARAQEAAPRPALPVTVLLVRHAETSASTKTNQDPPLSESGESRAIALERLLSRAGITHVFASEFDRTRATVRPLAGALELEIETVSALQRELQVQKLRDLPPGSVALVCGHSNTIPALIRDLGGGGEFERDREGEPVIAHDSYDRLFLVSLPPSGSAAASTIELRYGE